MASLERISVQNFARFKSVRLLALQESPCAFGSTYADECKLSDDDWIVRAARCMEESSIGFLAVDAGVSCGIVRATPDDRDSKIAWVESMWVAPSHRRSGIGGYLIESILEWASGRDVQMLKLAVTCNNAPAIAFYRRLGFERTGNTEPYPNDPALFEYEMARPVHPQKDVQTIS